MLPGLLLCAHLHAYTNTNCLQLLQRTTMTLINFSCPDGNVAHNCLMTVYLVIVAFCQCLEYKCGLAGVAQLQSATATGMLLRCA